MRTTVVDTPLGPFTIVVNGDAVVASGWSRDADRLLETYAPHLLGTNFDGDVSAARDATVAYFDGDVTAIDVIPVKQRQGDFIDRALTALRGVGAGETVSYAQLALLAGSPRAMRAAGSACARNAAPLFVPCHRVVRSDGSLGHFGFGVDAKRHLIDHERAALTARTPAGVR